MGARDRSPSYMPVEFSSEIRHWAPPELSGSELWSLLRICEQVYARGFDDGHRAGFDERREHDQRPSLNDVNRLRAAVLAEAKGDADGG